jgi:O-antigen ligase
MRTLRLTSDLPRPQDRRRERYLQWLAAVSLGTALVVAHLNMSLIGISPVEVVSPLEWVIRAALWFGPIGMLIVHSNGVIRALGEPSTVWRTRTLLWAAAVCPFVDRPPFALFDVLVFLAAAGLSAWYVTRVGWDEFLRVAAVTAGGVILVCLVVAVGGVPGAVTDTATGNNRLAGILTHPNQMGQVAGIALLCAWYLHTCGRRWPARGLAAISAVALLWSQSRTSIAAVALAFGWIALHRSGRATRVVGFLLGVVLLGGVIYAGTDVVVSQLARTRSTTEILTLTGRTELWATVMRIASEQPVTGYGLGNERITEASAAGYVPWDANSAHSDWLNTYLAFGLPGLGLWIAMWISYTRRTTDTPDIVRDAFVVFAFVLGLTEVAVGPVFPSFVYYMLIGCLAAVMASRTPPDRASSHARAP